MNVKKIISCIFLFSTVYIGTAQIYIRTGKNSNKHENNTEISFGNHDQKAIEIILTTNDKTISELFHSHKELRNTNKFKELDIDLENCISLENNAIKINMDKIGSENISLNSDNEKITIDIQIKNM